MAPVQPQVGLSQAVLLHAGPSAAGRAGPGPPHSPDCAKEDAQEQFQLSGDRIGVPFWAGQGFLAEGQHWDMRAMGAQGLCKLHLAQQR